MQDGGSGCRRAVQNNVMVATLTHIITFWRLASVLQGTMKHPGSFIPMQRTGMFPSIFSNKYT
jgi:hypothetical protein